MRPELPSSRRSSSQPTVLPIYGIVFAVLVCGTTLAAILFGAQTLQYYVVLAATLPFAIFGVAQAYTANPRTIRVLALFSLAPPFLAALQSFNLFWDLAPPSFLIALGMSATVLAATFAGCLRERDFQISMVIITVAHSAYCLYGLLQPAALAESARFASLGVHTAVWGEIAFAAVAAATLTRRWSLIAASLALALPVLIAAQMRGAAIATLCIVAVYLNSFVPSRYALRVYSFMVPILIVGLAYQDEIFQFVDSALLLSNPYRGITSGFSGRFDNWSAGLEFFSRSPLIGSSIGDPSVRYTHNGFIMAFAELGLFAGIAFAAGLIASLVISAKLRMWNAAAVITGYCLLIATSPRYINLSSAIIVALAVAARMFVAAETVRRDKRTLKRPPPPGHFVERSLYARQFPGLNK